MPRLGTKLTKIFDNRFFPATKEELSDYAVRSGSCDEEVLLHIEGLDDDHAYCSVEEMLEVDEDVSDFFNQEDIDY